MIEVLPTWLLIKAAYSWLPAHHPWKRRGRMFTLREWADGATIYTKALSFALWIGGLNLAILISAVAYDYTHYR